MIERHGDRDDTPIDEPAPTITSKARSDVWAVDRRTRSKAAGGGMTDTPPVGMDRPAPTLTGKAGGQWVFERPATTVCADPRIAPPGHRDREGGEPQFGEGTVKLTVREALILQSFRPDYPLQGTRTKQFEQVGNAIPPGLARAVLGAVIEP